MTIDQFGDKVRDMLRKIALTAAILTVSSPASAWEDEAKELDVFLGAAEQFVADCRPLLTGEGLVPRKCVVEAEAYSTLLLKRVRAFRIAYDAKPKGGVGVDYAEKVVNRFSSVKDDLIRIEIAAGKLVGTL